MREHESEPDEGEAGASSSSARDPAWTYNLENAPATRRAPAGEGERAPAEERSPTVPNGVPVASMVPKRATVPHDGEDEDGKGSGNAVTIILGVLCLAFAGAAALALYDARGQRQMMATMQEQQQALELARRSADQHTTQATALQQKLQEAQAELASLKAQMSVRDGDQQQANDAAQVQAAGAEVASLRQELDRRSAELTTVRQELEQQKKELGDANQQLLRRALDRTGLQACEQRVTELQRTCKGAKAGAAPQGETPKSEPDVEAAAAPPP